MQRENKWQERFQESGLEERIFNVDMFAINHGFLEWKGQSIPKFIQSEIDTAVAEEKERTINIVVEMIEDSKTKLESIQFPSDKEKYRNKVLDQIIKLFKE